MNFLATLDVILLLLKGLLAAANAAGAVNAVTAIQAAIDSLAEVHGTPVTKAQVENLRIEPQW